MTRKEIIRMAREAGFEIGSVTNAIYAPTSCETELERFAVLVAAAERDAIIDLVAMYGGPVDLEAAIRARGQA
jgi:hypothetical protein